MLVWTDSRFDSTTRLRFSLLWGLVHLSFQTWWQRLHCSTSGLKVCSHTTSDQPWAILGLWVLALRQSHLDEVSSQSINIGQVWNSHKPSWSFPCYTDTLSCDLWPEDMTDFVTLRQLIGEEFVSHTTRSWLAPECHSSSPRWPAHQAETWKARNSVSVYIREWWQPKSRRHRSDWLGKTKERMLS